jgi:hypothetical protein
MVKKLGKRARKFARKGLQVVQKQKRKQRTSFKRKSAPHGRGLSADAAVEVEENLNHDQNISQLDLYFFNPLFIFFWVFNLYA